MSGDRLPLHTDVVETELRRAVTVGDLVTGPTTGVSFQADHGSPSASEQLYPIATEVDAGLSGGTRRRVLGHAQ